MNDIASLHVRYDGQQGAEHRVRWFLSCPGAPSREGVLRITDLPNIRDPEVVLELLAVKQLALSAKKAVPGRYVTDEGKGLSLVFSRGAAKKVLLKKTAKQWLVRHAIPIQLRIRYAEIKVDKRFPVATPGSSHAAAKQQGAMTFDWLSEGLQVDTVTLAPLGTVHVSRHAVDRMEQSLPDDHPTGPWLALLELVRTQTPEPCELPRSQRVRKAIKYGNRDTLRLYRSGDYLLHFVEDKECQGGSHTTLVTLYNDAWRRPAGVQQASIT